MPKKCIGICKILTLDTRLEAIKYWTAGRPGNVRLVCCPVQNRVHNPVHNPVHSPVHSPVQSPESRFCTIPFFFHANKIIQLKMPMQQGRIYDDWPTLSKRLTCNRIRTRHIYLHSRSPHQCFMRVPYAAITSPAVHQFCIACRYIIMTWSLCKAAWTQFFFVIQDRKLTVRHASHCMLISLLEVWYKISVHTGVFLVSGISALIATGGLLHAKPQAFVLPLFISLRVGNHFCIVIINLMAKLNLASLSASLLLGWQSQALSPTLVHFRAHNPV